jgi:NodT family efflux transporter outer membrane factor (OMF) lipoprotein
MNILKSIFISMLSIAMLVSCALAPNDKQSALVVPKKTRSGVAWTSKGADLSYRRWWLQAHDPVLNQLIDEALNNNNQIQAAKSTIVQAQAQLKAAHLAWLPSLDLAASGYGGKGWDTQFTPEASALQGVAPPNQSNLRLHGSYLGFVPSYSLNVLSNSQYTRYARAAVAWQKASYQATRLSIIGQVSGSYFMLLGQNQQLAEQKALIQHLHKLKALEAIRHQDGASDLSATSTIDQELAANTAQLATIENSIAHIENAINLLINHNPAAVPHHRSLNNISITRLVPKEVPSSVLENRPDITMAYAQLIVARANIGITAAELFPGISLTGLLGRPSLELTHLLSLSTGLGAAQIAASIPLIKASAYQKVKAAKAERDKAFFNYLHTLRSALIDVDNSLMRLKKSSDAYARQNQALQAAEQYYRINLSRYQSGAQDFRGVANALINLDKAKIGVTMAKMEQMNSLVEAYQALGGGYQE